MVRKLMQQFLRSLFDFHHTSQFAVNETIMSRVREHTSQNLFFGTCTGSGKVKDSPPIGGFFVPDAELLVRNISLSFTSPAITVFVAIPS